MKYFGLLCLVFVFNFSVAQDSIQKIQNKGWVKVDIPEFEAVHGTNRSSSEELNDFFEQYNVYTYKQAVPYAKTPELLKYYELECDCDLMEFYNDLPQSIRNGFKDFTQDYKGEENFMLYDPTDYMWWLQVNDTSKQWLWYLELMEVDKAWGLTKGDTSVKVAVLDTEVDITHPDLASEILLPYDPLTLEPHQCIPNRSVWNDHGSAVASLVSAETTEIGDTAEGELAAIGFNTKMFFYNTATSSLEFCQKALHASTVMGVKVFTTSAGISGLNCYSQVSNAQKLILKEILDNGTSVVIPAGNGGPTCPDPITNVGRGFFPFNPSIDDRVIIVSSTGKDDKHYSFANGAERTYSHFPAVDVCAPGYDLMVAVPTECDTINWPYYGFALGTSFATPIVAGLMSLIHSINPCLSSADAKAILKSTTDPIVDAANYPGMVGTGRVNAYKAVQKAQDAYSSSVDLYIKDRTEDYGLSGGYHWQADRDNSPDIWVRRQADGLVNQVHQDPEYQTSIPAHVYVRIRNKSCDTSVGTEQLKLYWSKASSWSSWPQNWDGTQPTIGNVIDSITIPILEPGKDTILHFTWNILNPHIYSNWATCLLARIENSPIDPITIYPGRLDDDVYFNNNIAWKNLTIIDSINGLTPFEVDEVLYPAGRYMFIGNPDNDPHQYDIAFSESIDINSSSIVEEAEIKIIMDSVGWTILREDIVADPDFEIYSEEERSFLILNPDSRLENVYFPSNTRIPIYIGFSFLTDEVENEYYEFHVRQYLSPEEGTIDLLGGLHFIITRKERSLFYADAGDDQKIRFGETATLSASNISEAAIYNWYTSEGDPIGEGLNIDVSPEENTVYTLEVIAEEDAYKDYDDVLVEVQHNWIKSIDPNPAANNIIVDYHIEEEPTSASIMILNSTATISYSYPIDPSDHQINIDVSHLNNGWYTVVLLINGVAEDSETLIIQ